MRYLFLTAVAVLTLICAATGSAETIRVRPDGQISFDASISGPTRISVKDGRISKIIQSDSQFEMVNDENTGDVFLRFSGASPEVETGHIITESGHTIGFTMRPSDRLDTQTIIVELTGVTTPAAAAAAAAAVSATPAATGFAVNEGGASSYPGQLTRFVRSAIEAKIGTRQAAGFNIGNGTYSSGPFRARILSVAGADVRPQSYFTSRVLAVWVDDVLTGGRRWVVVVERK